MKSDLALKIPSAWRLRALCFISAAIITGCGAAEDTTTAGVGTGGTGTLAKEISGTVADGYLVNATVFLDRNGNDQLDAGEVFTQTVENGYYTLHIDSNDFGKYPIVALAIAGTTYDMDSNPDKNNPVKVKLTNSYALSLPKEFVSDSVNSNFISPISTQIHKTKTENPDMPLTDVMDQLRMKMNLPDGINMRADYVNLGSANSLDPNRDNYQIMHTAAQNMVPPRVMTGTGMMGR